MQKLTIYGIAAAITGWAVSILLEVYQYTEWPMPPYIAQLIVIICSIIVIVGILLMIIGAIKQRKVVKEQDLEIRQLRISKLEPFLVNITDTLQNTHKTLQKIVNEKANIIVDEDILVEVML